MGFVVCMAAESTQASECDEQVIFVEAAGKLASIVRINVRAVLSARNGYICEAVESWLEEKFTSL